MLLFMVPLNSTARMDSETGISLGNLMVTLSDFFSKEISDEAVCQAVDYASDEHCRGHQACYTMSEPELTRVFRRYCCLMDFQFFGIEHNLLRRLRYFSLYGDPAFVAPISSKLEIVQRDIIVDRLRPRIVQSSVMSRRCETSSTHTYQARHLYHLLPLSVESCLNRTSSSRRRC